MTESAIASARDTATGKMPQPIDNTKKCQACSLKQICLPKEMKYLLKEKIFKEETQLQLESATDRKINRLEEKINELQKQINSDTDT